MAVWLDALKAYLPQQSYIVKKEAKLENELFYLTLDIVVSPDKQHELIELGRIEELISEHFPISDFRKDITDEQSRIYYLKTKDYEITFNISYKPDLKEHHASLNIISKKSHKVYQAAKIMRDYSRLVISCLKLSR